MKFQEIKGLEPTGTLDEETAIILSGNESVPRLAPGIIFLKIKEELQWILKS